jgi:hypothetical protein
MLFHEISVRRSSLTATIVARSFLCSLIPLLRPLKCLAANVAPLCMFWSVVEAFGDLQSRLIVSVGNMNFKLVPKALMDLGLRQSFGIVVSETCEAQKGPQEDGDKARRFSCQKSFMGC